MIRLQKIYPKRKWLLALTALLFTSALSAQERNDKRLFELQSRFSELRFGVMMHFNMGTFTNEEWARPDHDPKQFNPAKLDCNQWADACKAAGMAYGILTTKHHDGFCLWDSKYTDYDVASSSVKRDVVAEYVKAFRSRGLQPCFYFSVWDRHNGVEKGGPEEEQFVLDQLTELLTNYGKIPLIIFDGWSWKMGHRLISFQRIYDHVKRLQPDCLVSEHNGNSNWHTDVVYYEGPKGVFPPGDNRLASQMALTINNGWFWHPPTANNQVKSLDFALDKLQRLEPLYCNFMLNIAPNRDGLFDDAVVQRLREIGKRWTRNKSRLPLPEQPDNMRSARDVKAIVASPGRAVIVPLPPATAGSPVPSILEQRTAAVMLDGLADMVSDRGGFSPFQSYWEFEPAGARFLELELNKSEPISKLYYMPAQLLGYNGIITRYRILAGDNKTNYRVVKEGNWRKTADMKVAEFEPITARFVKLEIVEALGNACVSEVGVGN